MKLSLLSCPECGDDPMSVKRKRVSQLHVTCSSGHKWISTNPRVFEKVIAVWDCTDTRKPVSQLMAYYLIWMRDLHRRPYGCRLYGIVRLKDKVDG